MKDLFEILEFDKIKKNILNYNINELSKKKLNELQPMFFKEIIEEALNQTREGYRLVTLGTFPSLTQLVDLSNYLDKIHKNATLNLEELYEFINTLEIVKSCKEFLLNNKLEEGQFFNTIKYISKLSPLASLLDQLKYCISPNYTLFDHASSKLKSIRTSIKKCENDIKEKLNNFLKNNSSILSDNYIATRGSHFVLPVKASNKNMVKGMVIDVSSSNNTLFMEPYFVTENNLLLEQLRYDEEVEVLRIIKSLCELVNKNYQELLTNNEYLAELSFMLLKGTYGLVNDYEVAILNDTNEVKLIKAKHPLIDKTKVIANDFSLGGNNNRIIVISGPNAGGKTVALKTMALLVLMNQCGLAIPVKEAFLPVFRHIFVDIGDEQSIEQSLSGFSSHMKNVSEIINQIDEHSLVIMDELGSKTDPFEGEALAKAIIEYINESKAIAMISTHYLGIKDYANDNNQITLASMGFDETNLTPTYKLLLNVVGRSYAIEISSRLGLKEQIILKAKQFKSKKANNLDVLIAELSKKLLDEEKTLTLLKEKELILNNKLVLIEQEKIKQENKLKNALEEFETSKEKMLEEAYIQIQNIVDEFKNQSNNEGLKHHLKNNALDKLNKLSNLPQEDLTNNKTHDIQIGDYVKTNYSTNLGLVKDIKGSKITVLINNTTMIINKNDIEKVDNSNKNTQNKKIKVTHTTSSIKNIPMSANLIGMHVDEALISLKNYLDAAMLVRYQQVSIIHGFGTGALRKAVHEYLKTCKYVEEYHLGGFNEGGAGATIVKLKGKK